MGDAGEMGDPGDEGEARWGVEKEVCWGDDCLRGVVFLRNWGSGINCKTRTQC